MGKLLWIFNVEKWEDTFIVPRLFFFIGGKQAERRGRGRKESEGFYCLSLRRGVFTFALP